MHPLLNKRVRLIDCDGAEGVVTSREEFRDGTERFNVTHWLDGKRMTVQVERCEFELVQEPKAELAWFERATPLRMPVCSTKLCNSEGPDA